VQSTIFRYYLVMALMF